MTARNVAASVRARLLNRSRETNRPFQELLQYHAMERFLYRLSRSTHRRSFILKGALLLRVWDAPVSRPTRDVDLLGHVKNDVENLARIVREICQTDVEPDGMTFDAATVAGARIKEDAEYEGVRLKFVGTLEKARVTMQVDVGFGDAVIPPAAEVEYPTLLDLPAPRLRAYRRETVVAEKFQAMVFLGTLNSRMKDFYDIWLLARQFDFDGQTLSAAIRATFESRGAEIDPEPVAFRPEFFASEDVVRRWTAFVRKGRFAEAPATLAEVVELVARFVGPVARAARDDQLADMAWRAPGPWK
jgi:hypothetical protein